MTTKTTATKAKAPTVSAAQLAASKARRLRDLLNDLRGTYDTGDAPATLARRAQLQVQIDELRAAGTPIMHPDEVTDLPR